MEQGGSDYYVHRNKDKMMRDNVRDDGWIRMSAQDLDNRITMVGNSTISKEAHKMGTFFLEGLIRDGG